MFKKLILSTILTVAASVATATEYKVQGTVTSVYAITGYEDIHQNEYVCEYHEVEVQNSNAGSGALGGAIVGGVLGKGIGGDDGAAAAGALLGAIVGANEAQKKGTRLEWREVCENVVVTYREEVVMYYVVEYEWNNYHGEFETKDANYRRGQKVDLTLTLKRF